MSELPEEKPELLAAAQGKSFKWERPDEFFLWNHRGKCTGPYKFSEVKRLICTGEGWQEIDEEKFMELTDRAYEVEVNSPDGRDEGDIFV